MGDDELPRRQDRADVTNLYNGGAPFTEDELCELGLNRNVNYLTGHRVLADSKTQLFQVYTKNKNIWNINLEDAPLHLKHEIEINSTRKFNEIVKNSGKFKAVYEAACGESTMHGRGVFMYMDNFNWCPQHLSEAELLIPTDAEADSKKLPYGGVETQITVDRLWKELKKIDEGYDTGWNSKELKSIIKDHFESEDQEFQIADTHNPELVEERRRLSHSFDEGFSLGIPVYYFFEVRHDKPGTPVDLHIVCRYKYRSKKRSFSGHEQKDSGDFELYKRESHFRNMNQFLHAFHMDCSIGGRSKWHKNLGLGQLNYMLDVAIEELLNRVHESVDENNRTMWQAGENADAEDLEQLILGHNRIIPEGVSMLQNRFQSDPSQGFDFMNFLRSMAGQNANSHRKSGGGGGGQLEVQFLADQSQAQEAQSGRMSNWYDYMDNLGGVVFSRFVNPEIREFDDGYAEVKEFQAFLKKQGYLLEWFNVDNASVHTNRVPGDGNRQRQLQEIMLMQQDMQSLGPSEQRKLLNRKFLIITGDEDVANDLAPLANQEDTTQRDIAGAENVEMGYEGLPKELDPIDVHQDHVPVHLGSMENDLNKAQRDEGMTASQLAGFHAKGSHVVLHLNMMQQMGQKELSAQFMQRLQQLSNFAEQFKNQLEEEQASKQPEIDPVKAKELELKERSLAQKEAQDSQRAYQFERTTNNREDMREHTKTIQINQEMRADEKAALDAIKDSIDLEAPLVSE